MRFWSNSSRCFGVAESRRAGTSGCQASANQMHLVASRRVNVSMRAIVLWSNMIYLAAALVALGVLFGLGAAPWRAYANVLGFVVVAVMALCMNWRAIRSKRPSRWSVLAITLNLGALVYAMARPEFAHVLLKAAVVAVPLLNASVLVHDWRKRVPGIAMGHDA